jgi:cell pole-organizing protein PopZ
MSQAAKAQEPSMEEILASIRRIIADDEAGKPAPKPAEAAAALGAVIKAFPEAAAPAAVAEPAAMTQNDIDAVLAGFDGPSQGAVAEAAEGADILELTEAMEATPAATLPQPNFRTIDASSDVIFADPSAAAAPTADPQPAPADPPPTAAGAEGAAALLSNSTTAAVTSAFGTLAHTVLVQNARTLDDLVREMLRPMLKVWLDDNLPTIVERLVRAEIERVSRGNG